MTISQNILTLTPHFISFAFSLSVSVNTFSTWHLLLLVVFLQCSYSNIFSSSSAIKGNEHSLCSMFLYKTLSIVWKWKMSVTQSAAWHIYRYLPKTQHGGGGGVADLTVGEKKANNVCVGKSSIHWPQKHNLCSGVADVLILYSSFGFYSLEISSSVSGPWVVCGDGSSGRCRWEVWGLQQQAANRRLNLWRKIPSGLITVHPLMFISGQSDVSETSS